MRGLRQAVPYAMTKRLKYWFCCGRCQVWAYRLARKAKSQHLREKTCEACGEPFTADRTDAKTCSSAC